MIYADDEEAGGDRIGDEDGDASVGGAHKKYGLEEGGIVVCRPDGYGASFEDSAASYCALLCITDLLARFVTTVRE